VIAFTAFGVPAPQGSTKAFMRPGMRHPVVTADCSRTKPWRQAIVDASREVMAGCPPFEGPVEVRVVFYLPRPKSAPKRITEPAKLPDLDKLVRALFDALVVAVDARKAFAGGRHDDDEGGPGVPRAHIAVEAVEP
jgi:crossover junction endodeoxyribonuclease RusA